ncbi:hypothetical protein ACFVFI_27535 [Streptomyces sp. NPDC057705]|uniref:hypothetical protein n=1 Tax=Streptomyces sp. NPDC057705 TaxID=3346222 RepID=UPI003676E770
MTDSLSFPPESGAVGQASVPEVLTSFPPDRNRGGGDSGEGGGGGGGEGRWGEGDSPVQIGVYSALSHLVRHGVPVSQARASVPAALDALATTPRRASAGAVELFIETSVAAAAWRAVRSQEPLSEVQLQVFAEAFVVFVDDWGHPPFSPEQPGDGPGGSR